MTQNIIIDKFLNQLQQEKQYKQYLKRGIKQYDILKYRIQDISVTEIKRMYNKIVYSYTQKKNLNNQLTQTDQPCWIINQLKIFVWLTVCYAGYYDQDLSSLNQEGWNFLVSVFYFKPLEIIQFQLLSLLKVESSKTPKKWSKAQDQLLFSILRDPTLEGKWNQIAKQFFIQSGKKYFRKPQKCREHWFNHLNPIISHEPWSIQQDLSLIQNVKQKGKRWAQISLCLGGRRTQHMVKNRYKSLQKKYEVQILKSSTKMLEGSMILKSKASVKYQIQEPGMKRTESSETCDTKKIVDLSGASFQTNIDGVLMEQQNKKLVEINQSFEPFMEQNLIETNEEKSFENQNKSFSLIGELEIDMQKYVDSFFF